MRSFHDQNLTAVSLCGDALRIQIAGNDGMITLLEIERLEKLRISDFEEGNVIANVRLFADENYSSCQKRVLACIRYVYKLDTEILNADAEEFVQKQCELVARGKLVVMEVEPSYGCYLVAVGCNVNESTTVVQWAGDGATS